MAILHSMKRPIFVRPLNDAERETLEAGLRSSDAFTLRRCQVLLASDRGENAYQIARSLGCNPQRPPATPSTPSPRRASQKRFSQARSIRTPSIGLLIPNKRPRPCGSCCTRVPGSLAKTRVCGRSGSRRRGELRGGPRR